MKKVIAVSGIAFTLGNIIWPYFDEPKLYYVPLAVLLSSLIYEYKKLCIGDSGLNFILEWLFALSISNVVKQILYTPTIAHINDYVIGAIVTLIYLLKFLKWKICT